MISLATKVVAGSLRFVMSRFERADSRPAASKAISSGPNETPSRGSGAWITSDIGYPLVLDDHIIEWPRCAEMIAVNYDKDFAKISQSPALRLVCRRRHQPRRPPQAKIRPSSPAQAMGAVHAASKK